MIGVWEIDHELPETRDLRRFIVSPYGVAFVRRNDAKVGYKVLPDTAPGTLSLRSIGDPTRTSTLTYRQTGEQLVMDGRLDGEATKLSLHRMDPSKLPLNARGFHWIQGYPFNR